METTKQEMLEIVMTCVCCGTVVKIVAPESDYRLWRSGQHIQDAMPTLTVDEREILISGICGKCFDGLGGDDE